MPDMSAGNWTQASRGPESILNHSTIFSGPHIYHFKTCVLLIFVCVLVCLCVPHAKTSSGHQIPWTRSYRQLRTATWVLGTEPGPQREQVLLTSGPSLHLLKQIFVGLGRAQWRVLAQQTQGPEFVPGPPPTSLQI